MELEVGPRAMDEDRLELKLGWPISRARAACVGEYYVDMIWAIMTITPADQSFAFEGSLTPPLVV